MVVDDARLTPAGRGWPLPRPLPAPWPLLARLPSRLTDLPLDARASLGRALDARLVRLALDDDGGALVLRGIGR